MKKHMNLYFAILFSGLWMHLGSCRETQNKHDHSSGGHDHANTEAEGHDHSSTEAEGHEPENAGHLGASVVSKLDIEWSELLIEPFTRSIRIPGTIQLDPDRQAIISCPLSARVIRLDATTQSTVKAGQRLALLEVVDAEVRHQQIRAVEVRTELLASRTQLSRQENYLRALINRGEAVSKERRRIEADLQILKAKTGSLESTFNAILASLKVAGLSPSQLKNLQEEGEIITRISLYAPSLADRSDLEIISRKVQVGQTVALGEILFEVAALDRLKVVGEAFDADLATVRRAANKQLPVSLLVSAGRQKVDDLKIFSIEDALQGPEGLIHFFAWLPNQPISEQSQGSHRYVDWKFTAGLRVQLLVGLTTPQNRFVLPASAIINRAGQLWIFVQHQEGLDRLAIQVEYMDEQVAVIDLQQGLKAGDRVATQGALRAHLALQAQADPQAAAANGHQGHVH